MVKKAVCIFGCFILFLTGCKLKEKEWDMEALVPLAHGNLSISNLVKDSSIRKNSDNTLTLVNTQTLKSLNISDLLKVPDTTFESTVSLKQISLGSRTLTKSITLGSVAAKAGPVTSAIIIGSNGKKIIVPPITKLSTGSTPIDANSFFKTATFVDGSIEMDIHNGFPVALTNIHFNLKNSNLGTVVIDDTIITILPGQTHVSTYPMAGKTVEGSLIADIISMDSPGSKDSVLIDTSNAITITMRSLGLHASTATAIFPSQNLVNSQRDVNYNLRGPLFKSFIIRSGHIKFTTKSTIKDSMFVNYIIPGAKKNGVPVTLNMIVPPSTGTVQSLTDTFALNGYNVDLSGQNHDSVNAFFNVLQVHIDSTGRLETLSLSDSVYIFYGLLSVVPEYAKGYLGTSAYTVGPQSAPFSLFSNLNINKLTIPKLKVTLQISNGVGAMAVGKLVSISAFNSKTNQTLPLICSQYINKSINIPAAADTLTPAVINLALDETNSNINKLLEILPDQFLYQMAFTIDPNTTVATTKYQDFIYYGSAINANLDLELPLQFGVQGLVLEDTLAVDFGNTIDLSRIETGTLHLITSNDYPLEAKVQLYLIDKNNNVTDSLINTPANLITAGNGDPVKPIPGKGMINVNLAQYQMQKLISDKRLILKTTLQTANAQVVKLYSTSQIKANLSADFHFRNVLK